MQEPLPPGPKAAEKLRRAQTGCPGRGVGPGGQDTAWELHLGTRDRGQANSFSEFFPTVGV